MKAKQYIAEYRDRIGAPDNPDRSALAALLKAVNDEMQDLVRLRRAKTDAAAVGIVREIDAKWRSICYGLQIDAFVNLFATSIRVQAEELYFAWKPDERPATFRTPRDLHAAYERFRQTRPPTEALSAVLQELLAQMLREAGRRPTLDQLRTPLLLWTRFCGGVDDSTISLRYMSPVLFMSGVEVVFPEVYQSIQARLQEAIAAAAA
jgi:hypothetical protein